jgi:GT2 family glycosyltransferase
MNVFGMVTTGPSHAYTPYALASFFQTTPFGADDRFVLIDNDGTYGPPPAAWPQVTYLANPVPAGFAANVNQVLRLARSCGADLFFLNNDLIFPPGWLEPLQVREPALLSPVSNFQFPVRVSDWWCGPLLDLADYLGHEDQLRALVRAHGERHAGYRPALRLTFFCIKIPAAIQEAVGELDEGFGRGGGEDYDYCLRCHRAGFPVAWALGSYVLHFMGKSTWRGGETPTQRQQREQAYLTAFRAKWGEALLEAVALGRTAKLRALPGVGEALARGDFRSAVEQALHWEAGCSPPEERGTEPQGAAPQGLAG